MTTARFSIHGIGLEVACEDPGVVSAVGARLRYFATDHAVGRPAISLEVVMVSSEQEHRLPGFGGRRVYEPPEGTVLYDAASDRLSIDHPGARVLARLGDGRVRISAVAGLARLHWLVSRPLLTLTLVEVLKRHGLFAVHAGAVARDGRAILVAGGSGSGKTTTCLALARAPFGFLGDDLTFLRQDNGVLRAFCFADEVDVTDETVGMLPALRSRVHARSGEWPKIGLPADALGAPIVPSALPTVLVFPQPTRAAKTDLHPIEPDEALLELVPNVLLTEPASSQGHLDALGELARTTRGYRMRAGRDFGRQARLLGALLG